jgi:hypothetical protein
MNKSDKSLLKSFVVFVLLVAISVVITIWYRERTATTAEASAGPQSFGNYISAPTPTPTPKKQSNTQEILVHSSKADKQLILRTTQQPDGSVDYTYFIADISGLNQRTLFNKTLPAGSSMVLPANSWDPTDTYVFIEEIDDGVPNYFVMKSTGGSVIDVGAVWKEKKIPYTIRTATGWASGTLLIIYTRKDDDSKGPAYWFEIPSTAILQLAS